jgi:glyoxylase-like metal-dependent hydrolase (beta-lactamase superfamily II)
LEESRFVAGKPITLGTGRVVVQRILCANASMMTGPGTNTYLLGDRELALVDPGPAMPAHTSAIMQALSGRPLKWIFVTHTHGDHSPGTRELQALTGASVIGFAPPPGALYQDATFIPDRLFRDGERVVCDGFTVQLIHTPGHVSNHVCFLLEDDGLLFTGDHILQGTTPVILPPDGDMRDYLASLEQLQALPLKALAPGHGDIMHEPMQMITTLIRHRQRREQKIVTALENLGPAVLDVLVAQAYDDVAAHLIPWAKKTLLAHLIKLLRDGRGNGFEVGENRPGVLNNLSCGLLKCFIFNGPQINQDVQFAGANGVFEQ